MEHCIRRVGKSREEKENKNMGNEGEIRMDGIGIHLLKKREGIDTAHKLTLFHIRDSGDLPRIERLIKCVCKVEHCIRRFGKSREGKENKNGQRG